MEKAFSLLGNAICVVICVILIGLAWLFIEHELNKPIGFYFDSELLGVGVKEPGRGFVQYRLDEFLPIYGKVPELHQEVQVGPRWQPPARPGKDPEPGSGGNPDKE